MTASRADVFLVEHGYARTRAEAQEAIAAGKVFDGGRRVIKPSQRLNEASCIKYERAHPYVSRGALKLIAALDRFELSPRDLVCVDIGASTGGFTEVLLERGADKVYAVDVGHAQMNAKLARDPRVHLRDGVNARELCAAHIPEPCAAIAADVSFIGLRLALPPALALAAPRAWLVALVKPQFEVGRFAVGKGGVVRDAQAQAEALAAIEQFVASTRGWQVLGTMDSPIAGGDGNREFLLAARKS